MYKSCVQYSDRCGKAFEMARKMHTKIDLGRMVTVYLNGGMYVDMDMYILRPLSYNKDITQLTKKLGHVLGLSKIQYMVEKMILFQNAQTSNNAMIISSKLNPILKEIIDSFIECIFFFQDTKSSDLYVHNTTGPANFNKFLNKSIQKNPQVHQIFRIKCI